MRTPIVPHPPRLVRSLRLAPVRLALALSLAAPAVVPGALGAQVPASVPAPEQRDSGGVRAPGDTARAAPDSAADPLNVDLTARIESRAERIRNERCASAQLYNPYAACRGTLQPTMGFQFNLKSSGTVANRVRVDVDYDSQREFDASNNISLSYEGGTGDWLRRVEVGNVNFAPPQSRFLTGGIASGNLGVQAIGGRGPFQVAAIAAQQRGNVVRDQQFTIGERAQRSAEREVEDYQVEARRFFFTIDPRQLPGYPNIDIIDRGQMMRVAASLPDTVRPSRLFVYRLQFGTQPQDPSGPRFRLLSDPARGRQVYDVLREGVDYYADPSLLWIALVRPLNQANERLVVAYRVRVNGRDTTWTSTGGTPDLAGRTEDQWANLVWDPSVAPGTPAFPREIRSAYRVGGGEILRNTVRLHVAAGSGDQEKPRAGSDATYLQMLGMAQAQNSADFDVENRLWPRPSDPNFNLGAGPGPGGQRQKILNDQFVVFPSLRPFAVRDSGLIVPGNPVNDAIYRTPGEYLYYGSAQRPASVYRLRLRYETGAGSDDVGSLSLGAVQLRRGSDRIAIDGRLLVRDLDYTIDYELGQVTFARPDTLFLRPRTVSVRYEENPLFAATPTTIFGLTSQYAMKGGAIAFTAISQRQQTSFTRPQLGLEAAGSTMMGVSGNYRWYLGSHPARSEGSGPGARSPGQGPDTGARSFASLGMTAGSLGATAGPLGMTARPYLDLTGEIALSRPQSGNAATAYIESFEGEGGLAIGLADYNWRYASLPATGRAVASRFGPGLFDTRRAATLAWQTNAADPNGRVLTRRISDIDSLVQLGGTGIFAPEQLLWLSLYPLHVGGQYDRASRGFRWTTPATAAGARFRSIQTVLAPAGRDLSRVEQMEFWALVDTSAAGRARNGTLVVDIGDISENAIAFVPETLTVARGGAGAGSDSLYTGKALAGYDSLDTERDPFSRAFNAAVNDVGLPGDRVPSLVVLDGTQRTVAHDVPLCRGLLRSAQVLGDTRTDCTVRNARLDEEDIDLDGAMNFSRPEGERILRWVIDLGDPARWVRVGLPDSVRGVDASGNAVTEGRRWVLIRAPFRTPDDSIGSPDVLRMRAMRLTLVSGAAQRDDDFTRVALARLRLVGAPWVRRAEGAVAGVGGTRPGPGAGRVITSVIGTNDRDAQGGLLYESPPGVIDELGTRNQPFGAAVQQINERSLRLQATDLPLWSRAEAYYRFPAGQQTFMGYRELRIWARGRNSGWGSNGDLQFFVKIGRDENNFYLYRTPVNAGPGREAWNPEVRVDLEKFYALRERLQATYLRNDDGFPGCTAADSALIVQSGIPAGGVSARRWAACDDGYLVYSLEPNVTPPNLAAAQEMAVGMLRVGANGVGAGGVMPGDTLELWVDDIRLTRVVNRMGAAGEVAINLVAPGLGDVRVSWSRRDPWFRQLNEQSTFADQGVLDVTSTLRLDRMLPVRGYALPLTISHSGTASTPEFLSATDLRGTGIPGLRRPSSGVTTYSIVARRTEPSRAGVLAPLVDNLGVNATYTTGTARTEYQDGGSHALTVGVDYNLAAASRELALPAWAGTLARVLGGWTMRGGVPDSVQPRLDDPQRDTVAGRDSGRVRSAHAIRWSPTQLRVTSALVRGDERRNTFFLPATGLASDEPRLGLGTSRLWRSGSALELRPIPALTARWDLLTVRDLRQYGDSNAAALAATNARGSLLGVDGLERERSVQGNVTFAPATTGWLRPRADFSSSYGMLRDPNQRWLLFRDGGLLDVRDSSNRALDSLLLRGHPERSHAAFASSASLPELPRRITASQSLVTALAVDLVKGLGARKGSWLARTLTPIELSWSRHVLSAFDFAAGNPSLGWQLGLGDAGGYRAIGNDQATSAGVSRTLSAGSSLILPFGGSLATRYRRTSNRNWMLRYDRASQDVVDGSQVVFPDVALRWNWRPTGPRAATAMLGNVGASVGYSLSAADIFLPGLSTSTIPELRTSRVRTLPATISTSWPGLGGLSLSAGYTQVRRTDSLPGVIGRGSTDEVKFDAGRTFKVPPSWGLGLRNPVRARAAWQQSATRNWVVDRASGRSSRLADQGRQSVSLNADTDLSETLQLTFQGANIVQFDRNLDRRINQLVLSAVLQVQFFSGQLR